MATPWRDAFDVSRTPYDARNALDVPQEALSDSNTYARKNRAWTLVNGVYVPEAPNDGKMYLRKSLGWTDTHAQVIPLLGVTDGSSAAAGDAGELKSAAQGTPQALTTATTLSLAQLTNLPAGDWDIWGIIGFTGGATTNVTAFFVDISTTVNTLTNSIDHSASMTVTGTPFNTIANLWIPTPTFSVSNAGTVTYYVNAFALFTVAGCSATGKIFARRRR